MISLVSFGSSETLAGAKETHFSGMPRTAKLTRSTIFHMFLTMSVTVATWPASVSSVSRERTRLIVLALRSRSASGVRSASVMIRVALW